MDGRCRQVGCCRHSCRLPLHLLREPWLEVGAVDEPGIKFLATGNGQSREDSHGHQGLEKERLIKLCCCLRWRERCDAAVGRGGRSQPSPCFNKMREKRAEEGQGQLEEVTAQG